MIKQTPHITVTVIYDGSESAKDVFADLILHRVLMDQWKKPLLKTGKMHYNDSSVPSNRDLSGLCGESA